MSDEKPGSSAPPPEGEEFVPAASYKEVQEQAAQRAKEAKELKARLAQFEADAKAKETAELEKKAEFEKLYSQEKQAREEMEARIKRNDELYKESIKRSHLKEALGGKVKDQYLDFADISKIELDDSGRPTAESLEAVASKFREEHSALIPDSDVGDPSMVPAGQGRGNGPSVSVEQAMNDRDAFHKLMKELAKKK